jgi:BirA family transcriptional regulator, biotin operon repressor / biotin---[acetyl-CoA-carboxylase] ligase
MLTKRKLVKLLEKPRCGEIICLEETSSTNQVAAGIIPAKPKDGTVVVADTQKNGSGRLGRSFYSPGRVGLYFSYIKVLPKNAQNTGLLTSFAALAVCSAVKTVCGIQPTIKWPNDVLIDGKKICGILTKIVSDSKSNALTHAIIGIGVNVNHTQDEFPAELTQKAGSLRLALGREVDRPTLCAQIITQLDRILMEENALLGDANAYVARLRELSCTIGKKITIAAPDGEEPATALDIAPDGGLVVKTASCTKVIRCGEIDDSY